MFAMSVFFLIITDRRKKEKQTILISAKNKHKCKKKINLLSHRRFCKFLRHFFQNFAESINPIRGSGFKSRVRHGWRVVRLWLQQQLRSKTGRQEVPCSIPGRACRPSRSEFSVVFSETRVNTGQDPLERPPRRASHPLALVPRETIGHKPYNQPTNQSDLA